MSRERHSKNAHVNKYAINVSINETQKLPGGSCSSNNIACSVWKQSVSNKSVFYKKIHPLPQSIPHRIKNEK